MKVRIPGQPFVTESITINYHSSLTNTEALNLIGKRIYKIEAGEYYISFVFTDGSKFIVKGFSLDEEHNISSLDTQFIEKKIEL